MDKHFGDVMNINIIDKTNDLIEAKQFSKELIKNICKRHNIEFSEEAKQAIEDKWTNFIIAEIERRDKDKLQKWVNFHKAESKHELLKDQDFRSLAIGFFVALGSSVEDANCLYEKCIKLGFY